MCDVLRYLPIYLLENRFCLRARRLFECHPKLNHAATSPLVNPDDPRLALLIMGLSWTFAILIVIPVILYLCVRENVKAGIGVNKIGSWALPAWVYLLIVLVLSFQCNWFLHWQGTTLTVANPHWAQQHFYHIYTISASWSSPKCVGMNHSHLATIRSSFAPSVLLTSSRV